MLNSDNTTSWESEDDAVVATNLLTDDDYSDSDDEFISYHDIAENDNNVTIKS